MTLTLDRLKELVKYHPISGRFTVVGNIRGKQIGDLAGSVGRGGYRRIIIDKRTYYCNVLAWFWMKGEMPPPGYVVDHRDGNQGNDRWKNLRLATRFQNMANRRRHRTKKNKLKGAYMNGGTWMAIIHHERRRYYLGSFKTEEQAHRAYCAKALELHGEFARFE